MDYEGLRESADRDQLWASLRVLLPDIQRIAAGQHDGSEREQQIIQLLARIVSAELEFRSRQVEGPAGP
jgi:hypothetical protein